VKIDTTLTPAEVELLTVALLGLGQRQYQIPGMTMQIAGLAEKLGIMELLDHKTDLWMEKMLKEKRP
jgi:hypothetical protein